MHMSTPKRIDFSDTSPENPPSTDASKTKKKRLASPVIKRIWNEDDELSILKGLVDYRVKTRHDSSFDWDGFFRFVQGSIHVRFSKEQLFSKVRKLRRKFVLHMERIDRGEDPLFTRLTDSQAFGYSNMIWGLNQPEAATNGGGTEKTAQEETQGGIERAQDETQGSTERAGEETQGGTEKRAQDETQGSTEKRAQDETQGGTERAGEETHSCEDEQMEDMNAEKESEFANGCVENVMHVESDRGNARVGSDELVNENGAEDDGKSLHEVGLNKTTEYKTHGEESHDDDDEYRIVEDAFETTILQGLSDWQRKLQLKKLMMNLGTGKRKELNDQWKALCSEEVKLKIKKLRFAAKLVEAANDG